MAKRTALHAGGAEERGAERGSLHAFRADQLAAARARRLTISSHVASAVGASRRVALAEQFGRLRASLTVLPAEGSATDATAASGGVIPTQELQAARRDARGEPRAREQALALGRV